MHSAATFRRISKTLLILLSLLPSSITHAQQILTLRASRPIPDAFPQITVYLSTTDGAGRHVPNLSAANFSVFEDETLIFDLAVLEEQVGTRQIFVLNTTADMKVRDSLGRSRYELARQALMSWWRLPEASVIGIDDLRLITAEGILVSHARSAAELAATLDSYSPTFEEATTGYDVLRRALDVAIETPSHPGMPTHVIFLTPLMRIPQEVSISNIITRARMSGVVLHPILFGQEEILEQPETEPLRQLAEATGGQFLLFDPSQGLDDLGQKILAQRSQYKLTYASRAITSGSHLVQVRFTDAQFEVFSEIQTFEITVMPPEVAFIQAPDRIIRETDEPNVTLDALPPTSEHLRLLITFPDGHTRELTRSQLIVNGEVVSERNQAPFDSIEWDLSGYLESQSHSIQAVVEDSLGLQGTTIKLPVFIEVMTPPRGLSTLRSATGPVIAAAIVLILGIVVSTIMISGGHTRTKLKDENEQAQPTHRRTLKRAGFRKKETTQVVEARLVVLDKDGAEVDSIPLTGVDLFLGRDPSMTAVPFLDSSVSNLHARLIRRVGGNYLLRDQGSVAGTWVNFDEIPADGRILSHGDIIHIGRVALRFVQTSPPPSAPIRIHPADDDDFV